MSHRYYGAPAPGRNPLTRNKRERRKLAWAAARAFCKRTHRRAPDNADIDESGRVLVYWSRGRHDWHVAGACALCRAETLLSLDGTCGPFEAGAICGDCRVFTDARVVEYEQERAETLGRIRRALSLVETELARLNATFAALAVTS